MKRDLTLAKIKNWNAYSKLDSSFWTVSLL